MADRRASTPSNAAEIAVPDMAELLRTLDAAPMKLRKHIRMYSIFFFRCWMTDISQMPRAERSILNRRSLL